MLGKSLIPILILLIVAITIYGGLCFVFNNSPTTAIKWAHYKGMGNDDESFSLNFPSEWKVENDSGHQNQNHLVLSLLPPSNPLDYSSRFTIGIEKSVTETNLTDYTNQVIKLLESRLDNFKLLDSTTVFFSNKQGERILYTHSLDGREIQVMQIWLKDGSKSFILTFATKPDYYQYFFPLVNNIVESFKITQYKSQIANASHAKLNSYDYPGEFEIQYPLNWKIDEKHNRVSFISPLSSYNDHHLERLDIYFTDSFKSANSTHSTNTNSAAIASNTLLSEIDYIQKNLQSLNLISITSMNHSQGMIKVLTYTYNSNIGPTFVREYLFDNGSKHAILVFSGNIDEYRTVLPQVSQMIKGFKFK